MNVKLETTLIDVLERRESLVVNTQEMRYILIFDLNQMRTSPLWMRNRRVMGRMRRLTRRGRRSEAAMISFHAYRLTAHTTSAWLMRRLYNRGKSGPQLTLTVLQKTRSGGWQRNAWCHRVTVTRKADLSSAEVSHRETSVPRTHSGRKKKNGAGNNELWLMPASLTHLIL